MEEEVRHPGPFVYGWRVIETKEGYTYQNENGEILSGRFWWGGDFNPETGVAPVEFLEGGSGCVTSDGRVVNYPLDAQLVKKFKSGKELVKVKTANKSYYTVYDPQRKEFDEYRKFPLYKSIHQFRNGTELVRVAANKFSLVNEKGEFSRVFTHWINLKDGLYISWLPKFWQKMEDGALTAECFYVLKKVDAGEVVKFRYGARDGQVKILTEAREFIPYDKKEESHKNLTPAKSKEKVVKHFGKISATKAHKDDPYYQISVNIDQEHYSLEDLGEHLLVLDALQYSRNKDFVYVYGMESAAQDPEWWQIDMLGNAEKLVDVCPNHSYDEHGAIVDGKGNIVVNGAREVEKTHSANTKAD